MRHAAPSQMGAKPVPGRPAARATRRRTLYFIATVLAAFVPLIVFAGLWLRSEYDRSRHEIERFVATRASALSQRLDADVQRELTVLQAIAGIPNLDEPDLPSFHATATRMIAPMPQWAFLGLVDASSGRQILNTLHPVGSDAPDIASAETIRRVVVTRKPALQTQGVQTDRVHAGRIVLSCVPVVRGDSIRFVLVAGLKAQVVQRLLEQTAEPSLLTVVTDERGYVLARSREPASGRVQAPDVDRASGLFVASTADGRQVPAAFQRSPLTGWTVLAASDRTPFDEMSARSIWATVGAGAVNLTLAAVLAVFLFYNVLERRVSDERLAASQALSELDARLLTATQETLAEQRKAASERDVLLREIYHRVKNNLQIVQSLLRLGSRDLKPDQREPFESAIRRIGAMARVHTLLYNSPDLASIDFKDYLDGLVREAAEAFGAEERGIRTVLEAESMRVPLDTAVPLAFVVVEILTNAFKHAFPGGRSGLVAVTASHDDGQGVLTVADNGVGLPAEPASRRSLGLTIIAKLVDQIGGSVEQPPAGASTFRVKFPLETDSGGAGPQGGGRA